MTPFLPYTSLSLVIHFQIQNAPLHDLFHMGSALHQRHDPSGQYGYSRSQYRGQVQSCQIRMNILQNQEDEEQQHLQSLNKKLTSSQKGKSLCFLLHYTIAIALPSLTDFTCILLSLSPLKCSFPLTSP